MSDANTAAAASFIVSYTSLTVSEAGEVFHSLSNSFLMADITTVQHEIIKLLLTTILTIVSGIIAPLVKEYIYSKHQQRKDRKNKKA